jgi:(E)-4-hydroxy-3-methylbut-2-enyl-diphosphate synthase
MHKEYLKFPRRKTRSLSIGGVEVGGEAPIVVQSMTNTHTQDAAATATQIQQAEAAGCELIRVAVPDEEAAAALPLIMEQINIPLIADIHFDHRLALTSLENGVAGLRINPANIGARQKVKEVVTAARERAVPIRIGVNSGSIEKSMLEKYGGATPEAMVESALQHVRILEDLDFPWIKVSLKASDIGRTLRAYQLLAEKVDYPFHAGITEAGTLLSGSVRSAAGLTLLLGQGLVDTLRISLTADPVDEVRVAYTLLSSLGIRKRGPNLISCPVCGRCEVDLVPMVLEIEKRLAGLKSTLTVAVMGCEVNGPGEAKEADIGIACGRGIGVIFKKGRLLRKVREADIVSEFVKEVEAMAAVAAESR